MSTGYQIKDQSLPHFLTLQIVYWTDIFTRNTYREVIIENLRFCRDHKGLEIFAYVLMSNHLHIIARSNVGELSNTLRDFKKYTSKRIVEEIRNAPESRREWLLRLFRHAANKQPHKQNFQVWTHENHAIEIHSPEFMQEKIDYIHLNPVRNGLVRNAEDYIYSSAGYYAGISGPLEVHAVRRIFSGIR